MRKRHSHRCPVCVNAVACYKKHCTKPQRITVEQCPYHSPPRYRPGDKERAS